jgi:spermidine synthase
MLHLLWLLLAHVGLPYFVLSSTGPLTQAWFSYHDQSDRVYRLYALSNVGSLAALLSYPFVIEPVLSVTQQSIIWSAMFCAFGFLQGYVALSLWHMRSESKQVKSDSIDESITSERPLLLTQLAWLGLPAIGSIMLLVVTNHVCQDVAVIPFLWVLPLSLYLVSFIISFDSPAWYHPKPIAAVTLVAVCAIQAKEWLPAEARLIVEAGCYMLFLLGICLLCHGEVARLKPTTKYLTQFYACISGGGAIGGLVIAVACPLLLNSFVEVPFFVAVATAVAFVMFFACQHWRGCEYDWKCVRRLAIPTIAVVIAPLVAMFISSSNETLLSKRNFFGVIRVVRDTDGIRLVHGTTIHGFQRHAEHAGEPTSYYGRASGVGLVIAEAQRTKPAVHIGVVGLGCGVLAAYGREADTIDMIEINPAVIEIAKRNFTFLQNSPATIHNHLGDGRLVLERMQKARFDVLVLDAFSSDAIPAHLLTCESMELYRDRLADDAVLAIHVSNNHLDLVPLVHRLSQHIGLTSRVMRVPGDEKLATKHSTWMLIASKSNPMWQAPTLQTAQAATADEIGRGPLWTDQHHNLASVLRIW